ncbi:sulfotransferase [Candidatus Albibeggiatoa sp. nov. BB20]|uniref:sulfotransferase n=1 Tax=Candidatus Albibeggiatoa sp. nov. BB20 TaxID=3162723 RepID=UPI0033659FBE
MNRTQHHIKQAQLQLKQNDIKGALNTYYQLLQSNSKQPAQVYKDFGALLLQTNNLQAAQQTYQAAIKIYPQQVDFYNGLFLSAKKQQNWPMAIQYLDNCLNIFPKHPDKFKWLLNKSEVFLICNQQNNAINTFKSLVTLYPDRLEGYAGLAQAMMQIEDYTQALIYWEQFLTQADSSQHQYFGLYNKADTLFHLGQYEESEQLLKSLIQQYPEKSELYRKISYITQHAKTVSQVLALLDELLETQPKNIELLHLKAKKLIAVHQPENALNNLNQILSIDSKYSPVYHTFFRFIQRFYDGQQRSEQLIKLLQKLETQSSQFSSKDQFNTFKLIIGLHLALEQYQQVKALIGQYKSQLSNSGQGKDLIKIAEKLSSPSFPDYTRAKVFVIGLNKTATSSLTQALRILNLHTEHWENPHTRRELNAKDACLFDALTDSTIACIFEQLYSQYPNAKFIYTVRDVAAWEKSMVKHYMRYHAAGDIQTIKKTFSPVNEVVQHHNETLFYQHDNWPDVYHAFDQRVTQFFKDKPQDKFLAFNVFEGDDWDKLCRFLNCTVPEAEFPWKNKAIV